VTSSLVLLSLAGQLLSLTAGALPRAPHAAALDVQQLVQPPAKFDAARFDSATALGLRELLDSAIEQGIPVGPLIDRALEGAARKRSGAEILKVVRMHATALLIARDALGEKSPVDELDAGARALRAGIDARTLADIRATRPTGSVVLPLVVLTDIVSRGVPQITARDAVSAIARMPRSDDALNGLQLTVAKNAVRGPGMAVDAINRYLRGTGAGALPSSAPVTTDRKPIRPPSP
jgi:hypothetical protein